MTELGERPETQDGAAIYSPLVLKLYDLWVLGFSNSYVWTCPTRKVLLPFFQKNLSANHLDVGVGTGYYPAKAKLNPDQAITFLDLNANSLQATADRVAAAKPRLVQEDVLNPSGALGDQKFDSISLFYLLHCLPGEMERKAKDVSRFLGAHLTENGVLYGATILGSDVSHNWLGQKLMFVYNKKGVFGNADDTQTALATALSAYFSDINIRICGRVALFGARNYRFA